MVRMRRPAPRRGQALVIFALSVATLILLVGLSIDGLRVFIAFGQAERAADAAALAGVVYLPQYPTAATPAPDGNDATTRALQEAAKNGFTDKSAITITVANSSPPTLRVAIRVNVALSLVSVMHSGPVSTEAVAGAEVLPPVTLGDNSASFGDQPEGAVQQVAALTSPNELKERGDPYSALCELGWSEASDTAHANASSNLYYTSLLHVPTNQPQYPSGPNCSPGAPGNPDHILPGFGGLATRTGPAPNGASYVVTLPQGGTGYSVWVWNARFVYQGSGDQNNKLFPQENIYTNGYTDNPAFYPGYAYALFRVPQLYNRSADVPVAAIWPAATGPDTSPNAPLPPSQIVRLPSLDANNADLFVHNCSEAWNLSGGSTYSEVNPGVGCLNAMPTDVGNWVQVGAAALSAPPNSVGYFRLTVDANSGYGQHAYAVKVCHNAASAPNCQTGGAALAAWNTATVILRGTTTQTYPLATIPAMYAGRQLTLALFNPGVGSGNGNVTLSIAPPAAGGTVTYPSYVRLASGTGTPAMQTSLNGDNLYHGKWVRVTITLPPDYAGGQWQLAWTSSSAAPSNVVTVALTLVGNPVTLLPIA